MGLLCCILLLTIDLYVDGNPHHLSIILTTKITIACINPLTFHNPEKVGFIIIPPFSDEEVGAQRGGAGLTGVVRTGI